MHDLRIYSIRKIFLGVDFMFTFKNNEFMNIYEKSLLLGLIFSILFSIVNFSAECNKISEKVLRLHIIANSNSLEDQELKLKVRNSIVNFLSDKNFGSLDETKNFALNHINELESLSQTEILKNGFNSKLFTNPKIAKGTTIATID